MLEIVGVENSLVFGRMELDLLFGFLAAGALSVIIAPDGWNVT